MPAVAQLVPAGGVELLDALAGSAAVLGHSETTLAEALERLTEGPVRAAVAYVPDSGGRLVPSVSAPVGAGSAGVAPAFESLLSEVASEGRPRILAVDGAISVSSGALGDRGVEWLLLVPVSSAVGGRGVLALGFAARGIDSEWTVFAAVIGALTGQQLAVRHLQTQVATLEGLLRKQATMDPLTGLPNQVEFAARLTDAVSAAEREGRTVAVAFLDLDRFRTVNDVLGHAAGDKLLQQVAGRLADRLGRRNVFRMAGDEYVLLREGLERDEDHTRSFEAALGMLQRPFVCDGHELFVTASIGIALYPYDGEDVGTLVKNADCAMFRAKERGGDTVECYSQGLFDEARRRLSLERSLHRAVEGDEITLDFQPQFDLATGAVTGFEALARWHHPELGVLLPGAFMPLAEETGLVIPIGERLMETACRQARQWATTHPDIRVWVNLSARQFHQCDLPALVGRCLQLAGLPVEFLGVEVTESLAMRHPAEAATVLGELARLGVKIGLDDFGTGYSSLAYLSRFSVDVLKLDRSFVWNAPSGGNDAAIARAIIGLAHGLGITVIAEGVETEQQRSFLAGERCDQAQGFLLARPMSPAEVPRFLDRAR
jgi:diguanylate cyclase (GGDEF)-like protein